MHVAFPEFSSRHSAADIDFRICKHYTSHPSSYGLTCEVRVFELKMWTAGQGSATLAWGVSPCATSMPPLRDSASCAQNYKTKVGLDQSCFLDHHVGSKTDDLVRAFFNLASEAIMLAPKTIELAKTSFNVCFLGYRLGP